MENNIMVNEEVVETAVEEIVTNEPKFNLGKFALVVAVVGGVALGASKLIKHIKVKAVEKKEGKKLETKPEIKVEDEEDEEVKVDEKLMIFKENE